MTNYKSLLKNNKIQPHQTSEEEIQNLLTLVRRDLKDAQLLGLSEDRAYATTYNAALQLCTIILAIEGYRTRGSGHHKTTFDFVELSPYPKYHHYAEFFNRCRRKRNDVDYDRALVVSSKENSELLKVVLEFSQLLQNWLSTLK